MEQLIVFIILITVGYFAGSYAESRHYHSIRRREQDYLKFPAVTIEKTFNKKLEIANAQLVTGSVVISLDYFKRALANLRNIFGGEVRSYETLIDRARREAILRMKAMAIGADVILNMRIETSAIGNAANNKGNIGSIEVIAYGTAITVRR
jgi:uncharacterized protein YbjQ (UPF0145 family)